MKPIHKTKPIRKARHVLVTTLHRGVFVGETADPPDAETITLTNARMVVHWPAEMHGVLGIAARPLSACSRLSPAVNRITLRNVTAVVEATEAAAQSWSLEPWH